MKVPPMELSLQGAKVRGNESSSYRGNYCCCIVEENYDEATMVQQREIENKVRVVLYCLHFSFCFFTASSV